MKDSAAMTLTAPSCWPQGRALCAHNAAVPRLSHAQHSPSRPTSPRTRPAPWLSHPPPPRTWSAPIVLETASCILSKSLPIPPAPPSAIVQKNRHQAPLCSLPPVWCDHSSSLSMKATGSMCGTILQPSRCALGETVGSSQHITEGAALLEGLQDMRPLLASAMASQKGCLLEWLLCSSYIVVTYHWPP